MAFLTESRVRSRAQREQKSDLKGSLERLRKAVASVSPLDQFDIFLSHCSKDEDLIEGVRLELQDKGFNVYVDRIIDPHLNPSVVTPETAETLRARMRQCETLVYVHTPNSGISKWMPWELGFFDGHSKGRVSILPIVRDNQTEFEGQEYLGMYPLVDFEIAQQTNKERVWVNKSNRHKLFESWELDPSL